MKANRAYELLVRKGRREHVEIVEIETGEVVLFGIGSR